MGACIRRKALLTAAMAGWAALSAAAGPLTLRLPAVEAPANGLVEVPVQASGGAGLGAMQGEIVFDPGVLAPESAEPGPLLAGALMDANLKKSGRLPFSFATTGSVRADGVLLQVRFRVLAAAGRSCPLGLEKLRAWDDAAEGKELFVSSEGGKVTVVGSIPWIWVGAAALVGGILLIAVTRRKSAAAPVPAAQARGAATAPCPHCGAPNRSGAKFCGKCGKSCGTSAPCAKCGAAVAAEARFCDACGTPRDGGVRR